MSVKKVNFRHMSHLHFPSTASKATKDWVSYHDTLDMPSLVLMENMERDGAETIFIAFNDLASVLGMRKDDFLFKQSDDMIQFINAKVAYVSMQTKHIPRLPEPIRIQFEHLETGAENPVCVHWDVKEHNWSQRGCKLVSTNGTHTNCACAHFGLVTLLEETKADSGDNGGGLHVSVVVVIVICAVVIFSTVVSMAIGYDYCRRVQVLIAND